MLPNIPFLRKTNLDQKSKMHVKKISSIFFDSLISIISIYSDHSFIVRIPWTTSTFRGTKGARIVVTPFYSVSGGFNNNATLR